MSIDVSIVIAGVTYRGTLAPDPPPPPPPPPIVQVPSPNHWTGRDGHNPIAIVLHTMGGSLSGCDAWFKNPASQVSSHYGVGITGAIHQYVGLSDAAWANGLLEDGNQWMGPAGVNPNNMTCSIETEDVGVTNVPAAQYSSVLALCQRIKARFPNTIKYLITHRVISPKSRPNCPGKRWTEGNGHGPPIIALANQLGLELRI